MNDQGNFGCCLESEHKMLFTVFFGCFFFLIGVQLLYNVVLVSGVQNQLYVYAYPFPLGPPSHPSRSPQSTELSSLHYTAGSHQLSVLHMAVHIRQSQSPSSSPPPHPASTHLFSMSVSQFLPCKQVHLYHISRFHIHALIYDFFFLFLTYFTLFLIRIWASRPHICLYSEIQIQMHSTRLDLYVEHEKE